eukprot:COSAG03_NODE_2042_length_3192_cov_1.691238_2_plen_161_part_00
MDNADALDDLVSLAAKHSEDALCKELEERKEKVWIAIRSLSSFPLPLRWKCTADTIRTRRQAVKINRLLRAAERATDEEQVQEALTAARELGMFEQLCKQVEVAHGLAAADGEDAAAPASPRKKAEVLSFSLFATVSLPAPRPPSTQPMRSPSRRCELVV